MTGQKNSGMPGIPNKLYFRIGEVSKITGLEPHVLRFWESEFRQIRPKRTESGQRLYRKKDVALILKIKQLLHEEKFTIRGAIRFLSHSGDDSSPPVSLEEIRNTLLDIRDRIDRLPD